MSTCETVMITPVQAKALRESANFELQRPMNEGNITRLRIEMEEGRFIPGTPIYFAVLPDKSLLALNGNHTLSAITQLTGAVELTFIYEPVKTVQEAAAIYSRFDLHRMRSWRDTLRAFSAENMLSSSTVWTSAFAAACGTLIDNFRNTPFSEPRNEATLQAIRNRDLRFKLMKGAQQAAELYVAAVGGTSNSKMFFRRAAVMGVGIEIMRYQPSSGNEFFAKMAADDGLRVGDPERTLLRYLRENPTAGGLARQLQSKAVSSAWNAFFQNKRIEVLHPGAVKEVTLAGTPWNGNFNPVEAYLPELFRASAPKPTVRKKDPAKIQMGVGGKDELVAVFA